MRFDDAHIHEPEGPATAAVLWLHGLGADGSDFLPLVPALDLPASMHVKCVFPNAPELAMTAYGGQRLPAWYDILSFSPQRRIDRDSLQQAIEGIHEWITALITEGIPSKRILVAGFSQGGAVALDAALSYPQPLAGLLALSTYLPAGAPLAPSTAARQLPIAIHHGLQDDVVDPTLGRDAARVLTEMGHAVQWHEYRMGHEVCAEQLPELRRFLMDCLE